LTAHSRHRARVRLEPWSEHDLSLLEALLGDPAMMQHLGGIESRERILARQERYERIEAQADSSVARMFKVVDASAGVATGWVGYWECKWRRQMAHEIGWSALPPFQGRGIARLAAAGAIAVVSRHGAHRFLHAFPSVDNAPSNAICRTLGFEHVRTCPYEYPPGNVLQCNDWRLDLGPRRG